MGIDRWIPRAKASNAENVSIWWRHHAYWAGSQGWADSEWRGGKLLYKPMMTQLSDVSMRNNVVSFYIISHAF